MITAGKIMELGHSAHKSGRPFRVRMPKRILRAGEQQSGGVHCPEIGLRDSGFYLTPAEVGA